MEIEKHELMDLLPKEQIKKIFSYEKCELGFDFMGFTEAYKALSEVIGRGYTIIDFGCYLAPQAYYFRKHKKYIGIDLTPIEHRYIADNIKHYQQEICKWIIFEFPELGIKQEECFVICNYVPDWGAQALIKQTFQNVFNYYP